MLACFVPANANLILNPSFEMPVVTAPSNYVSYPVPPGTGITDWTVVAGTGTVNPEVAIVKSTYISEGITFAPDPSDGLQWLDLTGFASNQFEGVAQTVATDMGRTYDLSFFVGNVNDLSGVYGTTSTVQVRFCTTSVCAPPDGTAGTLIGNFTNSSTDHTALVWEQFHTTFVAAGTSTTLDFLNLDPPTDNSNGLDSIVLTEEPISAVPEPGTLTLLGLGIIGLGLMRRLAKFSFHLPTR
jgi:hypothetical protein